jgi:hypothetical protein
MAESAAINKSLTVLGQVVHALNTNAVCLSIYYMNGRANTPISPEYHTATQNSRVFFRMRWVGLQLVCLYATLHRG